MKIQTFISQSPEETQQLGRQWGKCIQVGTIVVLTGALGSGKTMFVKGVAEALNVREIVNSPTFVFVNEYKGVIPVYHLDLYRVDNSLDAESIGYEEYLKSDGVSLIEWGDKIKDDLPKSAIWVMFEITGEQKRKIKIRGGRG